MKCKKCGAKASVNMRQHKLALCKEHYLEWVPEQTERFIKKYEMFTYDEKILVAVSGGKDSLALWDILQRLGYQADGLYLGLGIDGGINYSHESQRLTEAFAEERGLKLHVVDIEKEYRQPIPVLSEISHRGHGKPCAVCGLAKRHEMNRIARDLGYDVLATTTRPPCYLVTRYPGRANTFCARDRFCRPPTVWRARSSPFAASTNAR
jgi:tRNA-5-methyluridine54 2-sulfurtransferase